jgi:Zn-dependent protease
MSLEDGVAGTSFWNWSIRLWQTSGLEVRASWFLGIWILFDMSLFSRERLWWLLPFAVVVPFVSMLVHALAHVTVTRLVGGSTDRVTLSILNEWFHPQLPLTPGRQFAAAAAGPMVSLLLWLGAALAGHHAGAWEPLCAYVALTNTYLCLLNLLACSFFDGARLWRAVLWPLVGLPRAVRWSVVLAYLSAIGLTALGVWTTEGLLLIFGLFCLIATVQEHRSVRLGFDPVMMTDLATLPAGASSSWWGRWRQRRRQRAAERRAHAEAAEQEAIDRLLAKVSEQGLPALTNRERAQLQAISRKQQERQESESRK